MSLNKKGVKDQENNRVQEKIINSNIAVASIKNIEKNKAKSDDNSPETSPELLLTKFYRSRNKLNKPTSTTTAKTKIIMTILDDPDYDRLPNDGELHGYHLHVLNYGQQLNSQMTTCQNIWSNQFVQRKLEIQDHDFYFRLEPIIRQFTVVVVFF